MKPTNIVFPNGSIDPWHALSFTTTSADQNFTTIYIDGKLFLAYISYKESNISWKESKAMVYLSTQNLLVLQLKKNIN